MAKATYKDAGVDLIVVRELTGGIYFGKKTRDETVASDLCTYHTHEIERIVRVAARLAGERRQKLCSVDKANVLETSRLWREVTDQTMAREFPEIGPRLRAGIGRWAGAAESAQRTQGRDAGCCRAGGPARLA